MIQTICFDGLTHAYDSPTSNKHLVLDIPSWEIEAGEQILLRGVSGSGKTTLFNIAAGLLHPTTGTVKFGNDNLFAMPEAQRDRFRARHIGYVFQTHYLLNTLTAIENVIMPMAFAQAMPRGEWRKKARTLLESVGLAEFTQHRPFQLSNGQRMRVTVARALANSPGLVLADEPTASLDVESANAVMDLIQGYCRDHGATLLVASHDPALFDRFEQLVHLQAGRLSTAEGKLA